MVSNPRSVAFRREGDTRKGVGIIWCRGQYIDPAIQNDAEPLISPRATPSVFREAACSSGQSHYFFHSRETSTSTSTGTFLSSFSPGPDHGRSRPLRDLWGQSSAHSTTNSSWIEFMRRASVPSSSLWI